MLLDALKTYHRIVPDRQDMLNKLAGHGHVQATLIHMAGDDGMVWEDEERALKVRKIDWRRPGSLVPPRQLTRETTDEELQRSQKRRKIAAARLEEQRALQQLARLHNTDTAIPSTNSGDGHRRCANGPSQWPTDVYTNAELFRK